MVVSEKEQNFTYQCSLITSDRKWHKNLKVHKYSKQYFFLKQWYTKGQFDCNVMSTLIYGNESWNEKTWGVEDLVLAINIKQRMRWMMKFSGE